MWSAARDDRMPCTRHTAASEVASTSPSMAGTRVWSSPPAITLFIERDHVPGWTFVAIEDELSGQPTRSLLLAVDLAPG